MSIKVKDGDGLDKYYQTVEDGSLANPFQSVVPDFELAFSIREIQAQFGDTVSIWEKAKGLRKFGSNTTVGTTFETIAQFQGTTANETFVTTNIVDSISSSSASDTTQTITIEGHTVDVSGNLTFVVQDAILAGQTKVTLSTPLARCSRMYVKDTGTAFSFPADLVGTVYVYDDTGGVTAGVPTVAAATKCLIQAGFTQSQKCATSTSSVDYFILNNFSGAIGLSGGPSVDYVEIVIEARDVANGGAWRPKGRNIELSVGTNGVDEQFEPVIVIPPNHDVRVRARTNASTAEVTASFSGYLAIIV